MIVTLARLTRNPNCARRDTTPLDITGGQREAIDVLRNGMVLDGWRRVLAVRTAGQTTIVARVWDTEADYRQWLWLEVAAIQRYLDPDPNGTFGQSPE